MNNWKMARQWSIHPNDLIDFESTRGRSEQVTSEMVCLIKIPLRPPHQINANKCCISDKHVNGFLFDWFVDAGRSKGK